jgi:hypothetical protein
MKRVTKTELEEDVKISNTIGDCISLDDNQNEIIKPKPKEKKCDFTSITVSKNERNYVLNIAPSSKEEQNKTLEIIAGPEEKKAIITVETKGLIGPCTKNKHIGNVFYTPFKTKNKSDSRLEFEAFSKQLDNSKFITPEFYWPRNCTPRKYSFNANTCDSSTNINIHVYPDIKWEVSLGFDFEGKIGGKKKEEDSDEKKPRLEYSIKAKSDGKTVYEVESKSEDKKKKRDGSEKNNIPSLQALLYLWEAANSKPIGLLKDLLSKREPGSIKFRCRPELSANWGWQEIAGSPKCDFVYGFKAKFDPLFELSGKIDFAGPLLFLLPPPVGPFLSGTKRLLEATETGEIVAELMAHGSLSIEASGDKFVNNPEPQFEILGSGFAFAQFELRANLKLDCLIFSFGSGVKLGARAKFVLKDLKLFEKDYGANLVGRVDFEGLKCYLRAYVKAGISESKSGISDKYRKRQRGYLYEKSTKDDPDNDEDGKILGYIVDPYPNLYPINFPIIGEP